MNFFIRLLDTAEETPVSGWTQALTFIVPIGLMLLVFYFMLFRPQKKQQREMTDMRDSLAKGDIITTSGGIVGVVVNIKDDMILIESGADKTKIQVQKWAIRNIEQKGEE